MPKHFIHYKPRTQLQSIDKGFETTFSGCNFCEIIELFRYQCQTDTTQAFETLDFIQGKYSDLSFLIKHQDSSHPTKLKLGLHHRQDTFRALSKETVIKVQLYLHTIMEMETLKNMQQLAGQGNHRESAGNKNIANKISIMLMQWQDLVKVFKQTKSSSSEETTQRVLNKQKQLIPRIYLIYHQCVSDLFQNFDLKFSFEPLPPEFLKSVSDSSIESDCRATAKHLNECFGFFYDRKIRRPVFDAVAEEEEPENPTLPRRGIA